MRGLDRISFQELLLENLVAVRGSDFCTERQEAPVQILWIGLG